MRKRRSEIATVFDFPRLTDERAEEIAIELTMLADGDERIIALAVELVLGITPQGDRGDVDNLDRANAADVFTERAFQTTNLFALCLNGFKHRIANPKDRNAYHEAVAERRYQLERRVA